MTSSTPALTSLRDIKFGHILLWMPNWIGDVALAIPSVQSLRAHYPDARITAAARVPAAEILSDHPAVDTVIEIPQKENGGFWEQIRFAQGLKKYQFDLSVAFPNSFRSAFMTFLSGARTRLGYDTEGRGIFLTDPVAKVSQKEYRIDYFFKILSPLGLTALDRTYQPFLRKETLRAVDEKLALLRIDPQDFLITMHPGASKPERGWHTERFLILCQRLVKEYRAKIILLGNENDSPNLIKIQKSCAPGTVHFQPGLGLREAAAAIQKSKLFIGNDSGMMHLAAMVGTPVAAIFGPGSPESTGPCIDPQKSVAITRNYPCSPCRQNFFKECKPSAHNKPYCLEDISVKEVIEAVDGLIRRIRKT
ncbi:MAG: lipopolysaccharide heptosyltransferase II [Nitrospinae bacterium]|nr:lipopolysaccharide heptosyltransferase II [Nitrospinota bacterium]